MKQRQAKKRAPRTNDKTAYWGMKCQPKVKSIARKRGPDWVRAAILAADKVGWAP